MESSESPKDPVGSGPRDHRPAAPNLATRGHKRASTALTTTCGDVTTRDHSMDFWAEFKRARTQPPVEGSVFRDRSNDRDLDFKRPCGLPKRRRRSKKPTAKGNTSTVRNVPAVMTTPTVSFLTPPTHSLAPPPQVASKAWADYDEEDDRRVYEEEDPSALFNDLDQPACPSSLSSQAEGQMETLPSLSSSLSSQAEGQMETLPSLSSSLSSQAGGQMKTCPSSLSSQAEGQMETRPSLSSSLSSQSEGQMETLPSLSSSQAEWCRWSELVAGLWRDKLDDFWFSESRRSKAEEKVVALLRREDKLSREQDPVYCQYKRQLSHVSFFRDIEEADDLKSRIQIWFSVHLPSSSIFFKEFDVKVARFMITGDTQELREETDRLYRYEKHLRERVLAFRRLEHGISPWVGELLGEMLAQVNKDIMYITALIRMQHKHLPSKHCSGLSLSAFRKLKKKMMMRLRMDALKMLDRSYTFMFLLRYTHNNMSNALSTFGTFYWSSGAKRKRSVAERNTRKWLRHLHTRRAAVTQSRSRRGLKASGHKLCSHFTHYSGLALKLGDTTTVPQSSG